MDTCLPDIEVMWLKFQLPFTRPTYLANIYRPPDGKTEKAIELLEGQINEIMGDSTPDIVLMGDMNVNWGKSSNDKTKMLQFVRRMSLTQLIDMPTRITNTTRSTIDHVYTNNENFYCTSGVLDIGLSDHCLIYTCRKRSKPKQPVMYIRARTYRNFNENLFYMDMYRETWTDVYSCADPNIAAKLLTNKILNIADIHAPYKQIKVKNEQARWVTGEFLSQIDEKNHRCNIYKRRPTVENALRRRDAIRRVAKMKRILKRTYIKESLEQYQGNAKKTWQVICELWPNKDKSTTINTINGERDSRKIANALNDHFTSIGPKLSEKIT